MSSRHRALRLAISVTVAGSVLVAPTGHVRALAAEPDDLRLEGQTTYEIDVGAGVVRVTHDATLTNNARDTETLRFFFPEFGVPVLPEATNLAATRDDGRPQAVRRETSSTAGLSDAVVDLAPDLNAGETVRVRLTYDLPHLAPRSPGFTRVTPAFATFAAYGFGSPGRARFEIRAPMDFEVESTGAELTRDVRDGVQVLSSGMLDDPAASFTVVSARNDDALLTRELSLGAREIVIRGWPDDPEWATFAEQALTDGIPALERLIGRPWPLDGALTIVESASPYIYGYAGWYRPSSDTIEVGDALESRVILHETSHLWFNDALFADRWISEAFAETFTARALSDLGQPAPGPEAIAADDPGAFALAGWGDPEVTQGLTNDLTKAREQYGYNASFSVLDQIGKEIGTPALGEVVVEAATKAIAYRGDRDTETLSTQPGSRRLLDLLEEAGGSTLAPRLFEQYVLSPADVAMLPSRNAARARYGDLSVRGGEWTVPFVLREQMSEWQFDAALETFDRAFEILASRDRLAASTSRLGLELPDTIEEAYETGDSLPEARDLALDHLDAVAAIERAEADVDEGHGVWETVGLWWSDAQDSLADSRDHFERGDPPDAIAAAARARGTVARAEAAGQQRAAFALGVLIIVGLALVFVLRRRKAARPAGARPAE